MNMILTMTAGASNAGDNSAGRLDAIKAQLAKLGALEATGAASRRDAGLALVSAAHDEQIVEGDAEACYDAYVLAAGKAASRKHLSGVNEASRTAQVSKFRQFIKVGMLPDVDSRDVMARAVGLAEQLAAGDVKVKSPFDALCDVARAQIAQPDAPLTDEQITAAVSKPEPKQKDLIEKLAAIYKSTHKVHAETPMVGTETALAAIAEAIVEAGGEVPAMTKEEKARAEFLKKAAQFGANVSF